MFRLSEHKILPLAQAQARSRAWRLNGQQFVFTNGCFDLLHPGHVSLLEQARALGNRLIVGLNADDSVRRLKGPERPLMKENDRARMLAALECVDMVVLFEEDTPLALIEALLPDVLVKGGDYRPEEVVGRDSVLANGGRVEIIPLLDGFSTTTLLKRLRT